MEEGTIHPIGSAVSSTQECHNYGRKGHIARGCCSKGALYKAKTLEKPGNRGKRAGSKCVQANRESDSMEDCLEDSMVCKIKDREARSNTVQLHIDGNSLTMEVDTGTAFP